MTGGAPRRAPIEQFEIRYGNSVLSVGEDELARLEYNGKGPAENGYFNDRLVDLGFNEGMSKELGMNVDALGQW